MRPTPLNPFFSFDHINTKPSRMPTSGKPSTTSSHRVWRFGRLVVKLRWSAKAHLMITSRVAMQHLVTVKIGSRLGLTIFLSKKF